MAFVLFEESGDLKSATVMADNGTSLQVELVTGRRAKIKAATVYLRYESPAAEQLLPKANEAAQEIDLDFLWECAPDDEFGFDALAGEYFGGEPDTVQSAALLIKLKSAPIYFQRKGRGRFKAAPQEKVQQALAAVAKRAEQDALVESLAKEMIDGSLPDSIRTSAATLLAKPDKMSVEFKAFDKALKEVGKSGAHLLFNLGAFDSEHDLHLQQFTTESFHSGTDFGAAYEQWSPDEQMIARIDALPLASARAFSIDDSATTEIDDALSVEQLQDGRYRVGIHIAAPSLAAPYDSEIDKTARHRMSTVYMPGDKITMLPASFVEHFSLDAGKTVPAFSSYFELSEDGKQVEAASCALERVSVADNLRDDQLDKIVTEAALEDPSVQIPHGEALRVLWKLTHGLLAQREVVRGKPEPRFRTDFTFSISGNQVQIAQRQRDAPLSRIVAEMMILANSFCGGYLDQAGVAGIYRSQQAGKVRMSAQCLPHEGLGVAQYIWSTSPLRRYIDLANQRQLIAVVEDTEAPLAANSSELFAIMPAFEGRYSAYQEFQQRMERYWCLRWIEQTAQSPLNAVVVRDELIRLSDAPLYFRVSGFPELAPGRQILVDITESDRIELTLHARFVGLQQPEETSEPDSSADA
jgi:exoribonuclease-2